MLVLTISSIIMSIIAIIINLAFYWDYFEVSYKIRHLIYKIKDRMGLIEEVTEEEYRKMWREK